jgi:hypothetical protein
MADECKTAGWADDVPICTNEEFEIGYRSDELAAPMEACGPELVMAAAG